MIKILNVGKETLKYKGSSSHFLTVWLTSTISSEGYGVQPALVWALHPNGSSKACSLCPGVVASHPHANGPLYAALTLHETPSPLPPPCCFPEQGVTV